MSEENQKLLLEIDRIESCNSDMVNPQYEGWTVTIVDGFDGSYGLTLEGPTNFYKILVNADGTIKGALAGRTGQQGAQTNLGIETLIRLLSGFIPT